MYCMLSRVCADLFYTFNDATLYLMNYGTVVKFEGNFEGKRRTYKLKEWFTNNNHTEMYFHMN